ncbi:MAG: hypothetical protein ACE5G7_03295 [Candidatus Hydrothermarchaeaceae archaeon]
MYLQLLALMLGFKHSYDADHLVAVSNLIVRSRSTRQTFWMSVSWAVGHMLTASIITILLYQFKEFFLTRFLSHFELAVGAMLVILGAVSILSVRSNIFHIHRHSHGEGAHEHPHFHLSRDQHYHTHMFGIGIVHGLASNDELLILFTASLGITSLAGLLIYVAIFSLGVIAGMVLFGLVMSYPLGRFGEASLNKLVTLTVGTLSIVYGVWILGPLAMA